MRLRAAKPCQFRTHSGIVLAGDVGGTKSNLGIFQANGDELRLLADEHFHSHEFNSFPEMLIQFIALHPGKRPEYACFGVAGVLIHGKSHNNNINWDVDSQEVADLLGLNEVPLVNDLEANAFGIEMLGDDDMVVINAGEPDAEGNAAVIAAGTGLGEAGLHWDGRKYLPISSQGGLADFAPNGEEQIEMLRYLAGRYGHVSCEHVLSGPGLTNVYEFLRDTGRGVEPDWLAEEMRNSADHAAVVSRHAKDVELCDRALDLFVEVYGAEAGNVALKFTAAGGIYVGGGIAPRMVDRLKDGKFMKAFVDKGCRCPMLQQIPVRVILDPRTALFGAARRASLDIAAGALA